MEKLPPLRLVVPVTHSEAGSARRAIRVARDTELGRKSHQQRLAIAVEAIDVSRRELLNLLADVIYGFDGVILWPNGGVFEVTDTLIDDVFDDPDGRWISDMIRKAHEPPRQRAQKRTLARLRLLDLYFRIQHPERARLIAE